MKGSPFLTGKGIIAEATAGKDSLSAEARISTQGAGNEGFSINARGTNEVYWRDGDREFSYRNIPDYYGYGYGGYPYRGGYYGYRRGYHYSLLPRW